MRTSPASLTSRGTSVNSAYRGARGLGGVQRSDRTRTNTPLGKLVLGRQHSPSRYCRSALSLVLLTSRALDRLDLCRGHLSGSPWRARLPPVPCPGPGHAVLPTTANDPAARRPPG